MAFIPRYSRAITGEGNRALPSFSTLGDVHMMRSMPRNLDELKRIIEKLEDRERQAYRHLHSDGTLDPIRRARLQGEIMGIKDSIITVRASK